MDNRLGTWSPDALCPFMVNPNCLKEMMTVLCLAWKLWPGDTFVSFTNSPQGGGNDNNHHQP